MLPDTAALGAPAPRRARVPDAWHAPLGWLAAGAAALLAVTAQAWGAMLHQWWNIDTYNHLLIVPPIIVWLVALKEEDLARLTPNSFAPGLLAVAAALGVWRVGEGMGINLIAQVGAVVAFQAAAISMLGLRVGLLLALPLGLASFLVPFGDEIIPPLQFVTAEIAIALTHASGVPARIEGINIQTPAGLFIVAEACSGVKFLVAMVTLGVLVVFTRFTTWPRRAVFLLLCIVVPILANGVRAWATIYVAQFIGAERASGFDHIVYGWVFFAAVVAVMLAGAWRWFEREPEDFGWTSEALAGWERLARAEANGASPRRAGLAIIGLAGVAALSLLL
jgi:exosortase A